MRKLAEFIVDKRKFLLIIFIAAAIGSVIMSSHINVIQELTDYLWHSEGNGTECYL